MYNSESPAESESFEGITSITEARIPSRYQVRRVLGHGASGTVFEALDRQTGADVAVKCLDRMPRADVLPVLRAEFEVLRRVDHPHVIRMLDFDTPPGAPPIIVMDYIRSIPFDRFSRDIDPERLREALRQILSALDYLHGLGIVHGDLKPSNLLIAPEPAPFHFRIADFGFAQTLTRGRGGFIGGTIPYAAPEALRNGAVDPRSDLFSLGVICAELILASPVVVTSSTLSAYLSNPRASLPAPLPDRFRPFEPIIGTLLATDPERRFLSAGEVIRRLADDESASGRLLRGHFVHPRFTGRNAECNVFRDAVGQTAAGASVPVYVTGARGIGKSRFLHEIAMDMRIAGRSVYQADSGENLPSRVLADRIDGEPVRIPREALVSGITDQLARNPSVLLVDDIDQLPDSERDLVGTLADAAIPGLCIGLFAEIDVSGDRSAVGPVIRLRPLDSHAAGELVASCFLPRIEASAVERIVTAASGIPGRLVALASLSVSSGAVHFEGNRWTWNPAAPIRIPDSDEGIAEASIEALSPDERRVAGAIACMRGCFDPVRHAELIGLDTSIISQAIMALRGRALVTDGLRMRDGSLEAVAIGTLDDEATRCRLHRAAAGMLEGIAGREAEAGQHHLEAGNIAQGFRMLFEAAAACRKSGDISGAAALYFQIESQRSHDPATASYVWKSALERGNIHVSLGQMDSARAAYQKALDLLGDTGDPLRRSSILGNLALIDLRQGNFDATVELLLSARREAAQAGRTALEGEHLLKLGNVRMRQGRLEEASAVYEEAIGVLEDAEAPKLLAAAWNNLGAVRESREDLEGALRSYQKALPLKESAGDRKGAAILMHNIGHIHAEQGQIRTGFGFLAKARRLVWKQGEIPVQAQVLCTLAGLQIDRGRYRAAMRWLEKAVELAGAAGDEGARRYAEAEQARLYIEIGCADRAHRLLLDRVNTLSEGSAIGPDESAMLRRLALAALEADPDCARQCLAWLDRSKLDAEEPVFARVERLIIEGRVRSVLGERNRARELFGEARRQAGLMRLADAVVFEALECAAGGDPGEGLRLLDETDPDAALERQTAYPALLRVLEARATCLSMLGRTRSIALVRLRIEAIVRRLCAHLPDGVDPAVFAGRIGRLDMPTGAGSGDRRWNDEREETMEDRRKLMLLVDVTRSVVSESSLEGLLGYITSQAIALTGADRGFCWLKAGTDSAEALVMRNMTRRDIFGKTAQISSSILEEVMTSGHTVHLRDTLSDADFRNRRSILAYNLRRIMCAPLVIQSSRTDTLPAAGVLYVDGASPGGDFSILDRDVFESLARSASTGIENIRLKARLIRENSSLRRQIADQFRFGDFIGESDAIRKVLQLVERVASTEANVMILGESGTGKELIARILHFNGARASGPFLSINCAALTESILESELFGVEAGVATGVSKRQGLFAQAGQGTLFLDEIGDMPVAMQAKLLRVLQERKVRPVGGKNLLDVDVRIVCATHQDLYAAARDGRFREDLLYRLDVISVTLPPLRDRPDDIPILVRSFIRKHAGKMGRGDVDIDPGALAALQRYAWPGNVRELENQVERALIMATPGRPLGIHDFSGRITEMASGRVVEARAGVMDVDGTPRPLRDVVDDIERRMIAQTLERVRGNKAKAAEELGVSREGLRIKMQRLGVVFEKKNRRTREV